MFQVESSNILTPFNFKLLGAPYIIQSDERRYPPAAIFQDVPITNNEYTYPIDWTYGSGVYKIRQLHPNTPVSEVWRMFGEGLSYLGTYDTQTGFADYPVSFEIEFPVSIRLSRFSLVYGSESTRRLKAYFIEGSEDGSSWTLLKEESSLANTTSLTPPTMTIQSQQPYKMYRFNFLETHPASGLYLIIDTLLIFGTEDVTVRDTALSLTPDSINYIGNKNARTPMLRYPPSALTSASTVFSGLYYGNGTYVASSSHTTTGTPYEAYRIADDDDTTGFRPNIEGGFWSVIGTFANSLFKRSYKIEGYLNDQVFEGIDVTLQLPNAIYPTSFVFRNSVKEDYVQNFRLLASVDGTTWKILHIQDDPTIVRAVVTRTITLATVTKSYKYFKFMILKISGSTQSSPQFIYPTITRFYVYGYTYDNNGLSTLLINESNNIGIYNNNPTERLDVNGNIKCNDLILNNASLSTTLANSTYWDYLSFNDTMSSRNLSGSNLAQLRVGNKIEMYSTNQNTQTSKSNSLIIESDHDLDAFASVQIINTVPPRNTFLLWSSETNNAWQAAYGNTNKIRFDSDIWMPKRAVFLSSLNCYQLIWDQYLNPSLSSSLDDMAKQKIEGNRSGTIVADPAPLNRRVIVDTDGMIPWDSIKGTPDFVTNTGLAIAGALGLPLGGLSGFLGGALFQKLFSPVPAGTTFNGIGERGPPGEQGEQGIRGETGPAGRGITSITQLANGNTLQITYTDNTTSTHTLFIDYEDLAAHINYNSLANAINQQSLAQTLLGLQGFSDAVTTAVRNAFENGTISISQIMEWQGFKNFLKNGVDTFVDTAKTTGQTIKTGTQKATEKVASAGKSLAGFVGRQIRGATNPLFENTIAAATSDVASTSSIPGIGGSLV